MLYKFHGWIAHLYQIFFRMKRVAFIYFLFFFLVKNVLEVCKVLQVKKYKKESGSGKKHIFWKMKIFKIDNWISWRNKVVQRYVEQKCVSTCLFIKWHWKMFAIAHMYFDGCGQNLLHQIIHQNLFFNLFNFFFFAAWNLCGKFGWQMISHLMQTYMQYIHYIPTK